MGGQQRVNKTPITTTISIVVTCTLVASVARAQSGTRVVCCLHVCDTIPNTDCGPHGTWVGDHCECTTPTAGQAGYTGTSCDMRTLRDTARNHTTLLNSGVWCHTRRQRRDGHLHPPPLRQHRPQKLDVLLRPVRQNLYMFSHTSLTRLPPSWNHLALELARTSSQGDPDLCMPIVLSCCYAHTRDRRPV